MISEIENSELLYQHCEGVKTPNPIAEKSAKTIVVYSASMDFCVSMRILLENQCPVVTTTDPQLFLTLANSIKPDLLIVDAYPSTKIREIFEIMKRERSGIRILLIVPSRLSERRNLNDFRLLVDGLIEKPFSLRGLKQTLDALLHE